MTTQPYRDHPFDDQLYDAIIAAYQMERPRVFVGDDPQPEPNPIKPTPGCDIYRHGVTPRIRAKVWFEKQAHTVGYFDVTPEGRDRAAAAAQAAKDARDAGADLAACKRAGREAGGLSC